MRNVATRSISPENFDGSKGGGGRATQGTGANAARDLGVGWKISPSVSIDSGASFAMATIDGPGTITHIWLTTPPNNWRTLVLRAYWDHAPEPAIEVPLGDFFANGWGRFAQVSSSMIAANPHGGFNSYWPMPFQHYAELTVENLGNAHAELYYQVTYETDVDVDGGSGTFTLSSAGTTRFRQVRRTFSLIALQGRVTTSAPTLPGVPTHQAGGARASSRSISTAMRTIRRFAVPGPRTTSEAPGASTFRVAVTPSTRRRTSACPR
jgi:hypothetical protein